MAYKSTIEQHNADLQDILTTVNELPDYAEPVIQSLTVTENGTYTAATGVSGYSPVTVNVAGAKVATGYINKTSVDTSFTVNTLDFKPDNVLIARTRKGSGATGSVVGIFNTQAFYAPTGSLTPTNVTAQCTFSDTGFVVTVSSTYGLFGGYQWVAWKEA